MCKGTISQTNTYIYIYIYICARYELQMTYVPNNIVKPPNRCIIN